MKKKNNQLLIILLRPVIMAMLLLFAQVLYAQQQEETLTDTTVQTEVTIDSLDSEESGDEEEDDKSQQKKQHFDVKPASFDSVSFRRVSDSAVSAFSGDDDFWYANTIFQKKKESKSRGFVNGNIFRTILWLLIICGFIGILVIYLSNSNAGLFRSSKNVRDKTFDEETDDIFAINYQQEITKAIAAGNFRLAVRLQFLQLLRNLSDRSIINYTKDRTNFDYLMQVQHASWYNQFFRLTRNYEYVWYGHFDIDREKFELIKNEYNQLEQQLPRL